MKILVLALTALSVSFANAVQNRMGGTVREFLQDLREQKNISSTQYTKISSLLPDTEDIEMGKHDFDLQVFLNTKDGIKLKKYINQQLEKGEISEKTRTYLGSLLNLDTYTPSTTSSGTAHAGYTDNGIVLYHNKISPCTGSSCGDGEIYNGIWGFVRTSPDGKSSREYALQCHSSGLYIIDITDSEDSSKGVGKGMFVVQFIAMSGGNPWRDVAVYGNYAYVAGQASANLWVINLRSLSGKEPNGENSNPISSNDYKDRGYTNYGHTINAYDGILYLNTAGSTRGCTMLDLEANPFDPPKITDAGGGDCHDSFVRKGVRVGNDSKDLLFRSDGYQGDYSVLDITDVRTTKSFAVISETASKSGTYSHYNYVDEDNKYMYTFDESNNYDIGVVDLSDMTQPKNVNTFQWSGDVSEKNVRVHNGQVKGKYLITAYYSAGLRVFDAFNPLAPREVGKLETYRDPDQTGNYKRDLTTGYDGAWNVYTSLPSGKMLITDMLGGLFVFKLKKSERCVDSPRFIKTRGAKNQYRMRTCDYIRKSLWRKQKWCNKKKRGIKIAEECCKTCEGITPSGEVA